MNTATINNQPGSRMRNLFFNQDEQRLRGGWRMLIQGVLFLLGLALVQNILGIAASMLPAEVTRLPWVRLVSNLAMLGLVFLICSFAARRLDKRPFRAFGFHLNRLWWADLGFGLFLGAFLMLVIFLIERSAGWVQAAPRPLNGTLWAAVCMNLLVYLCVGITEELIFRGYQVRNLAEALQAPRRDPRLALVLAYLGISLFFGLMHGDNPNASLTSSALLMVTGLFMGLGYVLTGELALPIGIHITWNFFQGIVFGFPVSGSSHASSILQLQQGGPALWTGAAFGPEAGLVGLVAAALGALLILAWLRLTRGKVALDGRLAAYQGDMQ